LVAHAVAQRVVQEEHGHPVRALRPGEGAREAGEEERPVRQPGQGIVVGAVDQAVGRFLDGARHLVEGARDGVDFSHRRRRGRAFEFALGGAADDPRQVAQRSRDLAVEDGQANARQHQFDRQLRGQ
jgi:hypothetical protein